MECIVNGDGETEWSEGNEFARKTALLGVDHSSSKHS